MRPKDSNDANSLWTGSIANNQDELDNLPIWDDTTSYAAGTKVTHIDPAIGLRVYIAHPGGVPAGNLNPPDHIRTFGWRVVESTFPDFNPSWDSYDARPIEDGEFWDEYSPLPFDDPRWDAVSRPAMGNPSTDPQGPHGEDLWDQLAQRPAVETPLQQNNIQWVRTIINGYDANTFFSYLGADPDDSDDDVVTLLQSVNGTDGSSRSQRLSIEWPTIDPGVLTQIVSLNTFDQNTPIDTVVRDFVREFNTHANLFAEIEVALDGNGITLIDLDNDITDPAGGTPTGESYIIKLRDRARGCHEDATTLVIESGTLGTGDITVAVDQDTLRLSADLIAGDLHVCGEVIRPVDPNSTLEIRGLAEPEDNDDAATKSYVDNSPKPATDQIVRFTFSGVSERVESYWSINFPPDPLPRPSENTPQDRGFVRIRGLVGSRFDNSDLLVIGDEFQILTVDEDHDVGPGYTGGPGASASREGRSIYIGDESTFGEPDFETAEGTVNQLASTLNATTSRETVGTNNPTDFLGIQFLNENDDLGGTRVNSEDPNNPLSDDPDTIFETINETQYRFHRYDRSVDENGYDTSNQRSIYRFDAVEPTFETTQIRINGTNSSEVLGWTITLGTSEFEQSATFVFRENSDDDVDSDFTILVPTSITNTNEIAVIAQSTISAYLNGTGTGAFDVQRGTGSDSNLLTITHTGGGNIENAALGRVNVGSPTRLIIDRANNIEDADTIVFANSVDGPANSNSRY